MTRAPDDGLPTGVTCVICGRDAAVTLDLARRTIARGVDPEDPSYSVTAILPTVQLCEDHHLEVDDKELSIGWCDDERCREYGRTGSSSPCGEPYHELER